MDLNSGFVEHRPIEKRPSSSDFIDYKERVVQADVTINMNVDDTAGAKRMVWQQQYADTQRIGHYTGSHEIDIVRGDWVFMANETRTRAGSNVPQELRGTAFVSFNAFPIMNKRREQITNMVRLMGIAKITYRHGAVDQPLNGVSVQHKGALSTANNGRTTFYPGDKVVIQAPNPNREERVQEQRESASFRHIPESRITPRPEALSYHKIELPKLAILRLVSRSKDGSFYESASLRQLHPRSVADIDQLTEFALSLKLNVLQTTFNALAVFEAYGLIDFKVPAADDKASYDSLDKKALKDSLAAVLDKRASAAGASARRSQLLWIARKLELVVDTASAKDKTFFPPSQNLVDALLMVNYNSFMPTPDLSRKYDIRRFLGMGMENLGAVSLPSSTNYGPATFSLQLAANQANAASGYLRAAATYKESIDATIAATALNFSPPGTALDIVL